MNASEAHELTLNSKPDHSEWLENAIRKIKVSASNGNFQTEIYLGTGTYTNIKFKEEIKEKENLLKNLGYQTETNMAKTWGILVKKFDYWLTVSWKSK